jgi:hypothetical protein
MIYRSNVGDHILSAIQQNTFSGSAVPPCPACLLIVAFYIFGHIIVEYKGHIAFVDPHAKGVGSDHDGSKGTEARGRFFCFLASQVSNFYIPPLWHRHLKLVVQAPPALRTARKDAGADNLLPA